MFIQGDDHFVHGQDKILGVDKQTPFRLEYGSSHCVIVGTVCIKEIKRG